MRSNRRPPATALYTHYTACGLTVQADARAFVHNASGVRLEHGLPEQGCNAANGPATTSH